MTPQRLVTVGFVVLLGSIAIARPNDGLVLNWQSLPDGRSGLVLVAKDNPATICMVGVRNQRQGPMAPTDTYYSNWFDSGPVALRPFCAVETYDANGERIGRSPFSGRSLLEVDVGRHGYILTLKPGDRSSLDREYRDKPSRVVVRLPVREDGVWKEISLEKMHE